MDDFEVHIDLGGRTRRIGLARSNRARGSETILFEYEGAWPDDSDRFSLEPALALTRGAFAPPAGLPTFGSIGGSAPDTWVAASCSAPNAASPTAKAAPFARLQKATICSAFDCS